MPHHHRPVPHYPGHPAPGHASPDRAGFGPLGPGHGRIMATYNPQAPRSEFAAAAAYLGQALTDGDDVVINNVAVDVPGTVELELVYERTPHGTLALVLRAEWREDIAPARPESKLVFGRPTPDVG